MTSSGIGFLKKAQQAKRFHVSRGSECGGSLKPSSCFGLCRRKAAGFIFFFRELRASKVGRKQSNKLLSKVARMQGA